MLCQRCHTNPATVKYTEVVDGKVVHQDLCPGCLARYEGDATSAFSLDVPKPTAARRRGHSAAGRGPRHTRRTCPSCGAALDRIIETATAGCAACYRHFGQDIESALEGMQHGPHHRGKTPGVDDTRARLHTDLQNKRALMRSMLSVENYEEAAVVRDEIKRLEAGLSLSERGAD
ncbi:MAG: hypothetical protein GX580_04735 [Candidatus Hydrogenedens sp.]|nr:UvrB/UvrC motif-containing protein [Candidatus Hydrogenedentota bacterium]NLF56924.1 hypothetical protein [Candidatus Hydrogenedens sp.]